MNASYVTDDLAVGGADAAERMKSEGWVVVCVADNLPRTGLGWHFNVADGRGSDPGEIAAAVRQVVDSWAAGCRVFVHCRHGMNRSVCVAAAALCVAGRDRWVSDAFARIKAVRPVAAPRDDTLAEVLAVVMRLRPCGPNHE